MLMEHPWGILRERSWQKLTPDCSQWLKLIRTGNQLKDHHLSWDRTYHLGQVINGNKADMTASNEHKVITLSIGTDGQTVQIHIRCYRLHLIRVYTVCHSSSSFKNTSVGSKMNYSAFHIFQKTIFSRVLYKEEVFGKLLSWFNTNSFVITTYVQNTFFYPSVFKKSNISSGFFLFFFSL